MNLFLFFCVCLSFRSIQKMKEELEARVLKISNENALFYETNIKSIKLQHHREIKCLQEERRI